MSTDTAPGRRVYDEETIELGLQTLARVISSTTASEATGIPSNVLRYWRRHLHAERYAAISAEVRTDATERMAQQAEQAAIEQGETAFKLLDHLRSRIDQLSGPEAAKALAHLETAKGINVDKALALRGKPSQIIEHRSATEVLDSLQRRFPQGIVDAEVVEDDAEADSAAPSTALVAR